MSEEKNVKKKQAGNEEKQAVIYLGPAICGVVTPGTVYNNGLTPQLQKAVDELPAISRLIVPTGSAKQLRKDLQDGQSAASICYQKAVEYAREKGAKA